MTRTYIGSVNDFPKNKGQKIEVDGIEIAVFNLDGEFYGIQNLCTHKRLPLHLAGSKPPGEGEKIDEKRGRIDMENKCIRCPWHRLTWDLESGYNEATDRKIATYEIQAEEEEVYLVR